jgi:hypothetical protein
MKWLMPKVHCFFISVSGRKTLMKGWEYQYGMKFDYEAFRRKRKKSWCLALKQDDLTISRECLESEFWVYSRFSDLPDSFVAR